MGLFRNSKAALLETSKLWWNPGRHQGVRQKHRRRKRREWGGCFERSTGRREVVSWLSCDSFSLAGLIGKGGENLYFPPAGVVEWESSHCCPQLTRSGPKWDTPSEPPPHFKRGFLYSGLHLSLLIKIFPPPGPKHPWSRVRFSKIQRLLSFGARTFVLWPFLGVTSHIGGKVHISKTPEAAFK